MEVKIFDGILSNLLELGKCVKANNGYVGRADKVKCPNKDCNPPKNLGMQLAARSHHEAFNGHLKNWGILEKVYRHSITVHDMVFYACAVITQLSVANGEPQFEVEYDNE